MRIAASSPAAVVVDLEFLKPFKSTHITTFALTAVGGATEMTWTMAGSRNPIMSLAGRLFLDKAIGGDFDKGLAALKRAAGQPR